MMKSSLVTCKEAIYRNVLGFRCEFRENNAKKTCHKTICPYLGFRFDFYRGHDIKHFREVLA